MRLHVFNVDQVLPAYLHKERKLQRYSESEPSVCNANCMQVNLGAVEVGYLERSIRNQW